VKKLALPDLTKDRKDIDWLWPRTLFLTAHGSHAYGTNLPTSDRDYKGFAVPPKQYFLGFAKRFEQAEFKGDPDMVVYGIQKFFKLAADCNPSIIEVLFTDQADHQIVHPLAIPILQKRDLFISKKAKHTFSGYAVSQLKKIRSHKRWIDDAPQRPPERAVFGLPDCPLIPKNQLDAVQAAIRKQVEHWDVDLGHLDDAARIDLMGHITANLAEQGVLKENQWILAGKKLGLDDNFIDLMDRERRFNTAIAEWRSYLTWLESRNAARSELERKWGYDTKHGMHLIRLMRMCREILEGKGVLVKRPDAEELLEIRNGLWTYDQLLEWADRQDAELEAMYKTSKLPNSPPVMELDKLLVETVESML
jgi:predicted nucleotidyltransferase